MRVVLDTNILFSALISPHAAPHRLFVAWQEGRFDLASCRLQLDEIRRASRYPKLVRVLQPHRVGTLVNVLERGLLADDLPSGIDADDPDDAFLLALAQAVQADVLVTGDKRAGLLQRGHHGPTRILTAAQFCAMYL